MRSKEKNALGNRENEGNKRRAKKVERESRLRGRPKNAFKKNARSNGEVTTEAELRELGDP